MNRLVTLAAAVAATLLVASDAPADRGRDRARGRGGWITAVSDAAVPAVNAKSTFFDDVNEHVICTGQTGFLNGVSKFTMCGWIMTPTAGSWDSIFTKTQWSSNFVFAWAREADKDNRLYLSGSQSGEIATNIVNNQWHHVCWVYDGTLSGNANRLKGWLDGTAETLIFTGTIPATTNTATQNVEIGSYGGGSSPWDGYIDELCVWSGVALTEAQVQALRTGGVAQDCNFSSAGAPTVLFRMGDGTDGPTEIFNVATGGSDFACTPQNMDASNFTTEIPP